MSDETHDASCIAAEKTPEKSIQKGYVNMIHIYSLTIQLIMTFTRNGNTVCNCLQFIRRYARPEHFIPNRVVLESLNDNLFIIILTTNPISVRIPYRNCGGRHRLGPYHQKALWYHSVRMIETLPVFRTHLKSHLFRGAFS